MPSIILMLIGSGLMGFGFAHVVIYAAEVEPTFTIKKYLKSIISLGIGFLILVYLFKFQLA